ncbi:hypothetical protein [Planococcus beigongshangi]|uniref:hypothetical protein n=1 Tax=Planococcus beigongshangi TaxID=2782536 RepID=UPI00193AF804|nr:hypothetical protein [Planococcus beigongshangi]
MWLCLFFIEKQNLKFGFSLFACEKHPIGVWVCLLLERLAVYAQLGGVYAQLQMIYAQLSLVYAQLRPVYAQVAFLQEFYRLFQPDRRPFSGRLFFIPDWLFEGARMTDYYPK